jgi:phage tail-like protein
MRTLSTIVLALVLVQGQMAAVPQSELPRYSFTVAIEGRSLGTFREVSGLTVETEVIEFREGGGGTTIFLPGLTKYSPVKLTRAFTGDSGLWEWYTTSAQAGHVTRVSGVITVFDPMGHALAQYTFVDAWPKKYVGPTLVANSKEVPVETIEIVHAGLLRSRDGGTR